MHEAIQTTQYALHKKTHLLAEAAPLFLAAQIRNNHSETTLIAILLNQ